MSLKNQKQGEKPQEPVAILTFDYEDEFWEHLKANDARSVFITASLEPPQRDPRPSSTGAFYLVMTALIEKATPHLAQFSAPLEGLATVDDVVDSKGTQKKIWQRVETFFEQARERGLVPHRGQWRRR